MSDRPSPIFDPLPNGEAIYVFCFARMPLNLDEAEHGLDEGRRLAQSGFRRLTAVWCPVALDDFCGPAAEARLSDLAWIGPRVVRHQQVVESLRQRTSVLPCRFGTLFSSPIPLAQLMKAQHLTIARFLHHMADKEEWAVKGHFDAPRAEAWLRRAEPGFVERDKSLAESPGRRYFQEKQLQTDIRKQARLWAREQIRDLHEICGREAVETRSLALPPARGVDPECLLNTSFLIPLARLANFRAEVTRLNAERIDRGLTFELSGPWPPYSFSPALPRSPEAMDEVSGVRHHS